MTGGLVVVGASLAGLRAVQAARRSGYAGPIALIGAEAHLPYDRPPLSKAYLATAREPDYHVTEQELRELGVRVRLSTAVDALRPDRQVVVAGSAEIAYDALVIATGAAPRRLPGVPDLDGIVTLRTLDDAIAIRDRLRPDLDVVIVGAGFIGSEIASSARERGARVTILDAAPIPLVRAVGDEVGAALATLHQRHGVRLLRGTGIAGVRGADGRVTGVELSTGEVTPADLVVVGIGAAPATAWLAGSGIDLHPVDGGVVCDRHLETSLPGVYAAGDVAHWPNELLDTTMRLENWTNAADQGGRAGTNAVVPREARTPHATVPYFWSDWYGRRIQFAGTADADAVTFAEGGPGGDRFVALHRRGERLVGAATLDEPRKIMKLRRLIGARGSMAEATALLEAMARTPAVRR